MGKRVEFIVERILRAGMSKKFQKALPDLTAAYLRGEKRELVEKNYSVNWVDTSYNAIQTVIRKESLEKLSGIYGINPKDINTGVVFVDFIMRHSINDKKLKKKLFAPIRKGLGARQSKKLEERYEDDSRENISDILNKIGKDHGFYLLLVKYLLNNKS